MEMYGVSLRIQSECGKIRTGRNSVFGHFTCIATWKLRGTEEGGINKAYRYWKFSQQFQMLMGNKIPKSLDRENSWTIRNFADFHVAQYLKTNFMCGSMGTGL